MKAISLWQPWASLWLSRRKIHETRSWSTSYRGNLLVHAAKKVVKIHPDDLLYQVCVSEFGANFHQTLVRGHVLGFVNLVTCLPTTGLPVALTHSEDFVCGDFTPGRWAWRRRASYTVFATPIPFRGFQQLFEVPNNLIKELPHT